MTSFNPRLTSAARRTSLLVVLLRPGIRFNPRLTSAARRTINPVESLHIDDVSIHASRQPRGEPLAEGQFPEELNVSIHASRQPGGELSRAEWRLQTISVSIHASRKPRGERGRERGISTVVAFQSTPHVSREANAPRNKVSPSQRCFNPRLTSAARRTHAPASY